MRQILSVIVIFALSFVLIGCSKSKKPSYYRNSSNVKKAKKVKKKVSVKAKKKKKKKATVAKKVQSKKKNTQSLQKDAEMVINYGTGTTYLKIKRKKRDQLKDLNKKHNDALKEALK